MNFLKLIIKSIKYYRKQHLALFLGILVSTMVLTGALIVGDSVRGSLQQMVDQRLGNIRYVLSTGDRYVRTDLARELTEHSGLLSVPAHIVPGIGINPSTSMRLNNIQVVGINKIFGSLFNTDVTLAEGECIISENMANKLGIIIGDELLLRLENASKIPINAPFAQEAPPSKAIRTTVVDIVGRNSFGYFSLLNNQKTPYNVFVSLQELNNTLELSGWCNTILTEDDRDQSDTSVLNKALNLSWTLLDAGISVVEHHGSNQWEIRSDRIFIDPPVVKIASSLNEHPAGLITYLVNSLSASGKETPYSFVTTATPYMPFTLNEDEMAINQWLANDLNIKPGDEVSMKYFTIGPLRQLIEKESSFIVKKIIPIEDIVDSTYMPSFPGLYDAGSCSEWNTGIPIDLSKIRDKDEDYWDRYKGTPKAVISLGKGLKIWDNTFGEYTALRFNMDEVSKENIENQLMSRLHPRDLKLIFRPAYEEGRMAAANSVDFGELFLSLSFFVIVAGILLSVLLYSLSMEERKIETGILAALGYSSSRIQRFRITESFVIALIGAIAGSLFGIIYNYGLLAGLNTVWYDAVKTSLLQIHIKPVSLLIGTVAGFLIALVTIYFVTKKKLKQQYSELIKEGTGYTKPFSGNQVRKYFYVSILSGFISLALIIYAIATTIDASASIFLVSGATSLIFLLTMGMYIINKRNLKRPVPKIGLLKLAVSNISRNSVRNITIIALIALGTFSIIITGANKKSFSENQFDRKSGTGGYTYWLESNIQVIYNLNETRGKENLGLLDEPVLDGVQFVQIPGQRGDDASCLNLNQVQKPQILGVDPILFDSLDAFSFARLLPSVDTDHPWLALEEKTELIPAYVDQTVITWGLQKKVGDTLTYVDEFGEQIHLLLTGGLQSSVFQGNILIDKDIFYEHFPSTKGTRIMLIDAPLSYGEEIINLLNQSLMDYGVEITDTRVRLAEFNSVTNTYLSVFMILGGLGMVIGTIGLGIVLFRNLLERRKELGVLTAMGFTRNKILTLLFYENVILLFSGIFAGIVSAVIGIFPALSSPSFNIPWLFLIIIISAILVSGVLWIYVPLYFQLKKDLVKSLRNE